MVALGTGTGVGKTWVGAQVLAHLRAGGVTVAARKPVQSFVPGEEPTDAQVLARATGERPQQVCPAHRWFEMGMAPPVAAAVLGRPPFTVADLVAETTWPDGVDVGWVETAGGPRSPVAGDGDSVALAAALEPDVAVLVADAGLGAINAVRLSVAALAEVTPSAVVVLNHYDDGALARSNRDWLRADGLDVITCTKDLTARLR